MNTAEKTAPLARRMLIMTAGIVIMAVGISLFKLSLMGNDPYTSSVMAAADRIGIDFSIILLAVNAILFFFEAGMQRSLVGPGTFVNWFLVGPLASLFLRAVGRVWTAPESFAARLPLLFGGVLILSLSCALYQTADLGIAPYDALSIMMAERLPFSYFWCRMITDCVCGAISLALGGIVGLGTLVCALGLGPFISFFTEKAAKPLLLGRPAARTASTPSTRPARP